MNILSIIKQLEKEKKEQGKAPYHITILELNITINNLIKDELNRLYIGKQISIGKTINGKWVKSI